MTEAPFVKHIHTEPQTRRADVTNPTWEQTERLLNDLGRSDLARIDLSNDGGTVGMTVYGESERFHISIDVNETQYYCYSNGSAPTGRLENIGGRSFEVTEICRDRTLLIQIVQMFWRTGGRLSSVAWNAENVSA